jgi:hypothetical protein
MSTTDFAFDAATLATMDIADLVAAFGLSDVNAPARAATVAARKRGTVSAVVATDDTAPMIVLISADHNPLA